MLEEQDIQARYRAALSDITNASGVLFDKAIIAAEAPLGA